MCSIIINIAFQEFKLLVALLQNIAYNQSWRWWKKSLDNWLGQIQKKQKQGAKDIAARVHMLNPQPPPPNSSIPTKKSRQPRCCLQHSESLLWLKCKASEDKMCWLHKPFFEKTGKKGGGHYSYCPPLIHLWLKCLDRLDGDGGCLIVVAVPPFGEKKALFHLSRQVPVNCYVVKLYSLSLGCILSLHRCHILLGFLTLLTTPSWKRWTFWIWVLGDQTSWINLLLTRFVV